MYIQYLSAKTVEHVGIKLEFENESSDWLDTGRADNSRNQPGGAADCSLLRERQTERDRDRADSESK